MVLHPGGQTPALCRPLADRGALMLCFLLHLTFSLRSYRKNACTVPRSVASVPGADQQPFKLVFRFYGLCPKSSSYIPTGQCFVHTYRTSNPGDPGTSKPRNPALHHIRDSKPKEPGTVVRVCPLHVCTGDLERALGKGRTLTFRSYRKFCQGALFSRVNEIWGNNNKISTSCVNGGSKCIL